MYVVKFLIIIKLTTIIEDFINYPSKCKLKQKKSTFLIQILICYLKYWRKYETYFLGNTKSKLSPT